MLKFAFEIRGDEVKVVSRSQKASIGEMAMVCLVMEHEKTLIMSRFAEFMKKNEIVNDRGEDNE
jgi:hypothetical protein